MYNRKRADESDAAASKQGDTARKTERGAFPFFPALLRLLRSSFREKKFHFFFREREKRGSAKKRFPLPLQSASPGERGQGRFREIVENLRLFHNMRTEKTTG